MSRSQSGSRLPTVSLDLTADELRCLIAVSAFHQRYMGPMRHLVRLTGSREVRGRFRFLDDESAVLRSFAEAMLNEAESQASGRTRVQFTLRALVAFWGRLLSSTQSPRARRRLSTEEVERREAVSAGLENAIRRLRDHSAALVDAEIETRRVAEQTWMRERLAPASDPASPI